MTSILRSLRRFAWQQRLLQQQTRQIMELERCILHHQRALVDLAVSFRVAIESPEVDLRDELDSMIAELSNMVANTEEYVV